MSTACTDVPFDIIFLVDSSWSINAQDYQRMKDFMKSVINKSTIGQNEVHVGIMQYSTKANLEFSLNKFYSKNDMLQAIEDMQHMKEGTLTGNAISEVSEYFNAAEGGRPRVKQYLIVITDGESQDSVTDPAKALRAKGVVIYAIGVGKANTTQLREISDSPDRVFYESNFEEMRKLDRQLILKFCEKGKNSTRLSHQISKFFLCHENTVGTNQPTLFLSSLLCFSFSFFSPTRL